MKRPLLILCIFYIFGILTYEYVGIVAATIISVCIISAYFLAPLIKNEQFQKIREHKFLIIGIILIFNFGAFYTNYKNDDYLSLLKQFSGQQVFLEGTIVENTKKDDKSSVIILKINKINEKAMKNEKTRVNYYSKNTKFSYGDLVKVNGKIELPQGQRNPGGFNYKRYLLTKNIYTSLSTSDIDIIKNNGGDYSKIIKYSLNIKEKFVKVIEKSLTKKHASLLEGIVLSKTDELDEQLKNDFSNSGLSHLMAASGANIVFLIMPFLYIFKRFRIKEYISTPILTFVLILFTIITGSTPSVVRAVIMCLVVLYGKIINRQSDILTSIAFSAFIVLIYNPYVLFDIGFQLSYAATLSIVLLCSKIDNLIYLLPKYLRDILSVTLSAQIGVIPIIAYYFNKISLISFFSNILAAPMAGIILILGFFMVVLGQINIFFSQLFGGLNYILLSILSFIAEKSVLIPYSIIRIGSPNILIIMIYYILIICFMYFSNYIKERINKNLIIKSGIFVGIIITLYIGYNTLFQKPLEVSFIDVGQGDSIFIRTPEDKIILIDGGGSSSGNFDVGEKTIVPFLLDRGVKKIDIIVLSHTDSDHVSGLDSITNAFRVNAAVISESFKNDNKNNVLKMFENKHIKILPLNITSTIDIEKNLELETLGTNEQNNDGCLVLQMKYKNKKFLFTGDISTTIEQNLIKSDFVSKVDVLKVAHHGSKYSTCDEFLKVINPSIAVISVGKNNYGHPDNGVINRLLNKNVKIYRTDKNGCVSIFTNGDYIKTNIMNEDKVRI